MNTARAATDLLLDYSQNEKTLQITPFGGEPTLSFAAICEATEYAGRRAALAGKSVRFSITTNGTLLTAPMVSYFALRGIKVLLSIDGLKETHNRFRIDRLGRGSFDRVTNGMKALKRVQPWIDVRMTILPETASRLVEDVVGLYESGVNQFVIAYATGVAWSDRDVECYRNELNKLFDWYNKGVRHDLRIYHFEEEEANEVESFFGCQAGRNSIAVSPSGEISPCSKLQAMDDIRLLAKLGDVSHGLTHLSNRLELVEGRALRQACEAKGIAEDYKGGCFVTNYEETGNLFNPSMMAYRLDKAYRSGRSPS